MPFSTNIMAMLVHVHCYFQSHSFTQLSHWTQTRPLHFPWCKIFLPYLLNLAFAFTFKFQVITKVLQKLCNSSQIEIGGRLKTLCYTHPTTLKKNSCKIIINILTSHHLYGGNIFLKHLLLFSLIDIWLEYGIAFLEISSDTSLTDIIYLCRA